MNASGKSRVPQHGRKFCARRKPRKPCCCLAMKPASAVGHTHVHVGAAWEQPMVKTSGKRKGYKVFGLIDYLDRASSFSQGQEGSSELHFDRLYCLSRRVCWNTRRNPSP